jgi:hypothetical protein
LVHWRDELINLGKTNRLLYYTATKTSNLEIESPAPEEVLGKLRESGKRGWAFYLPEAEPLSGEAGSSILSPPRARDELLTSKPDAQSINATLRNLERRSAQEYMDKGLAVLYLAVGMLEWVDPADDESARSPLLLVPVTLHRDTPRQPFTLLRAEEEVSLNPA